MKIILTDDGIFIPKDTILPVRIVNDLPRQSVTFGINFACSMEEGTEVIEFMQGLRKKGGS